MRCFDAGVLPTHYSTDIDGFIGVAQAGDNFQKGKVVIGVEADISWTSIDGSDSIATDAPPFAVPGFGVVDFEPAVTRVSQDLNWLGTVRGRLGYALHNNLLLYATGGVAFGDVDYRYSLEFSPSGDYARASESETQTGWTVGGGGEYSFGHWSLKAEYLYHDLGEDTLCAQAVEEVRSISPKGGPIDIFFKPDYETKGHIVRVGLNFKLGSRSRQPVPLK